MDPCVIHTGRKGGWGWIKILYLLRCKSQVSHIFCQLYSFLHGTARVGRHKIGNCVLLFSGLFIGCIIFMKKFLIDAVAGLSHIFQHLVGNMFRCHSQLAAYMMLYQLSQEGLIPVCHYIIKTYSGTDKYFLYSGKLSQLTEK